MDFHEENFVLVDCANKIAHSSKQNWTKSILPGFAPVSELYNQIFHSFHLQSLSTSFFLSNLIIPSITKPSFISLTIWSRILSNLEFVLNNERCHKISTNLNKVIYINLLSKYDPIRYRYLGICWFIFAQIDSRRKRKFKTIYYEPKPLRKWKTSTKCSKLDPTKISKKPNWNQLKVDNNTKGNGLKPSSISTSCHHWVFRLSFITSMKSSSYMAWLVSTTKFSPEERYQESWKK